MLIAKINILALTYLVKNMYQLEPSLTKSNSELKKADSERPKLHGNISPACQKKLIINGERTINVIF